MSYRAQEDHWGAKIGGFLLLPVVASIGGTLLGAAMTNRSDTLEQAIQKQIVAQLVANGVGAYVAYRASEREDYDLSAQAFARGGMWAQIANAAVFAAAGAGAIQANRLFTPEQARQLTRGT